MATQQKYSYYVEDKTGHVSDRPRKFLEAFAAVLRFSNYGLVLGAYARMANRCGRCAPECQVWEATGEDRDLPCNRSELLFQVYRRYFTAAGRMRAGLLGGFTLTDDYLDRMAEDFYRCVACRRCKSYCPVGIDHGLVTHLSRWLLAEVGIIPKALVVSVRQQLEGVGNTSGIPVIALKDTLEFLQDDFADTYGARINFPLDVEGAEYIFFPAVSDYLLEPETLMGNALVMALTGASWTIGTGNFDGINYGLFYSDRMYERIIANLVKEARRLKAKKILIGECGHATRSAWLHTAVTGNADSLPVVHFAQYTHKALMDGKIPLKPDLIEEPVTYHDPCNIARAGKITEEPREIIRRICKNFIEMTPNRTQNYCCGGGSGLVSIDEIRDFRTKKAGKRKADQIRATGAKMVIAPCANCKKQLSEVIEDHELGDIQVVGLHNLLLRVVDFEAMKRAQDKTA